MKKQKEENKITEFFSKESSENKKNTKAKKKTVRKINSAKESKLTPPVKKTKAVVKKKKKIATVKKGKKRQADKNVFTASSLKKKSQTTTKKTGKKRKINIEKLITGCVFLMFAVAPFFVTYQTFQGINFEKTVFVVILSMIIGLLMMVQFFKQKELKIAKTFLNKYIIGLLTVYIISTWFSVDKWHSLVGFIGNPIKGFLALFSFVILFIAVTSNFNLVKARKAFWILVSTISIIGLYTILSGLGVIPVAVQKYLPFSFSGSIVGLTILLSIGVPLLTTALFVYDTSRDKNKKVTLIKEILLTVVLIVLVIDLVMLKLFALWGGIVAGMIIFTFLLVSNKKLKEASSFFKGVLFTILAVIVIITGLTRSNYQYFIPNIIKIKLPDEIHVGLPLSYDIIKQAMLSGDKKQIAIGSGPATYGYDFAKFHSKEAVPASMQFDYIYQGDGLLGENILTTGIIGMGILIIMILAFLKKAAIAVQKKKDTQVYLIGLFSATIAWLVNALFEQLDAGSVIIGVFLLSITAFFILESSGKKNKYHTIKINKLTLGNFIGVISALVVTGGLFAGIVFVGKGYLADMYTAQAFSEKELSVRVNKIAKSTNLQPREGMYYTKLGQTYLLLASQQASEDLKDGNKDKTDETKMAISKAISYSRMGAKLMPNDIKTLRVLARTYTVTGQINPAEETYKRIIELEPNNIQYYVDLGDLQLMKINNNTDQQKQVDKAVEYYQKALAVNPRVSEIYYKLAIIFSQTENIDEALKNIAIATKLQPNNNMYKFTLGILLQKKGGETELASAEKIYKALLVENPNSIDVRIQLGSLYEEAGLIDEAKKQYETVKSVIGDKEEYRNISKAMDGFIENLNNGKLNTSKSSSITEIQTEETDESTIEETADEKPAQQQVEITVDEEGPINVRSEGAITGEKVFKIKESGVFQKIDENDKWVQIIIPANDEHEEITGWVHKKFVVE